MDEGEEELIEQTELPSDAPVARKTTPAKIFLFGAILITLFIALLTSVMSNSSIIYTILGFLPTIIALLIFLWLLEENYKDVLFWGVPLVICLLFFFLAPFLNKVLMDQLDVPVLTGVNLILSYIFLAVMMLIEYFFRPIEEVTVEEIEEFKPELLDKYIHTIEDKCKAINFAIGRVYRGSNGGSKNIREKIKVPNEWYNEFNSIKPDEVKEKKDIALAALTKIHHRLTELLKPEKDIFSETEVHGLKHIARDRSGKDRVLDVLSVNDQDPVEEYFLGAVDFCKRITTELEKL